MQKRNPMTVALLPFVTFGIYGIYWYVKTKGEMNAKGAKIPTALLLIIPIANVFWLWKYSEAVEHITGGKMQGIVAFLLFLFIGPIGIYMVQDAFNKLDTAPAATTSDTAPAMAPSEPTPPVPAPTPPTPPAPSTPTPPANLVQ